MIEVVEERAHCLVLRLCNLVALNLGNDLGGLDVLLVFACVQQSQTPDLTGIGCVVSRVCGELLAVCGLDGVYSGGLSDCQHLRMIGLHRTEVELYEAHVPYLFPVVKALVVVLEDGVALLLAGLVIGAGIDDVACEHLLPEREATARTWTSHRVSKSGFLVAQCRGVVFLRFTGVGAGQDVSRRLQCWRRKNERISYRRSSHIRKT